jgi:hypothetical protein
LFGYHGAGTNSAPRFQAATFDQYGMSPNPTIPPDANRFRGKALAGNWLVRIGSAVIIVVNRNVFPDHCMRTDFHPTMDAHDHSPANKHTIPNDQLTTLREGELNHPANVYSIAKNNPPSSL